MDTTDGVTRAHEDIDRLCRRLYQWVGTGRELLGLLTPRLVETRRGLEERDNELTRLRAEVERLTRERAAIADAVEAAMRKIDRLEILGRLPVGAPSITSDAAEALDAAPPVPGKTILVVDGSVARRRILRPP